MNNPSENLLQGVDNLLLKCMGIKPGNSILLVLEPSHEQVYDATIGSIIEKRIIELGGLVTTVRPALIIHPTEFPDAVAEFMSQVDHTLFLSRIGDYSRFVPLSGNCTKTICYAQNTAMLSSPFSTTCYKFMSQLHRKLENELLSATQWHITCNLGTNIQGTFCWPSLSGGEDDNFSLTMFPVATFKPVPGGTAHGTVALSRWLVPGAAEKIESATLAFNGIVFAEITNGMLVDLSGPPDSVQRVREHYDHVSAKLNINRNRIHSWHAGINPHTFYNHTIDDNLAKWGGVSFGSPRFLHFHTCGDEPPGEIAWPIFNPTVVIDGELYWQEGQFVWLQRQDNLTLLNQVEGGTRLLEKSACIGI